jgi:hypothetical protein
MYIICTHSNIARMIDTQDIQPGRRLEHIRGFQFIMSVV